MSQVITLRLPDASAEEVRQIARRERRSVSEVSAYFIEEGLRVRRFPPIEFRSFNGERHACIKDRLQVWQLIEVARGYGMDMEKTATHLVLKPEQVQSAFAYYAAYPEEIDQAIAENNVGYERLKQMLPGLERITLPAQAGDVEDVV